MTLLLCLALAAADANATISVAPAPGAPPVATIVVAGRSVPLDAKGRGWLPAETDPSGEGLKFYRVGADVSAGTAQQLSYYPADGTLVSWPLRGAAEAKGTAEVVLKRHEGETWEGGRSFAATIEAAAEPRRVRFWIPAGTWDAALLVPGFAPAFALEVAGARDPVAPVALSPSTLVRGGRLTAKVLDARTGRTPEKWMAMLSRVAADPTTEEAKFFAKRPVAADRATLDFTSLPLGGWELEVEAKTARRHELVSMFRAGTTADLGTIYLLESGRIRVALDFPVELPPAEVVCNVLRLSAAGGPPEPAGRKTLQGAEHQILEFDGLEPGAVAVDCGSAGLLYKQVAATVVAGDTVDVAFSFSPVTLEGTVRQGEELAADARIIAPVAGPSNAAPETRADELGQYRLRVWPQESHDDVFVILLVSALGEQNPAFDRVEIPPGRTRVDHDVLLPSGEVRGRVVDAKTLAPIEGATVRLRPSVEGGDSDAFHTYTFSQESAREGTFRIRHLDDREVEVEVFRSGYATVRLSHVKPDGHELDVRLDPALRFAGIVVDEAGTPIPGVLVGIDIDAEGMMLARKTTTSEEGRFSFDDIGAGAHVVAAFRCGSAFALQVAQVRSPEEGAEEPPLEVVTLRSAARPILVRLLDDAGAPVAGIALRWAVSGMAVPLEEWAGAGAACGYPARTDADGRLVLHDFPPGRIDAVSLMQRLPVGTFDNDGTQNTWTIRLPQGANLRSTEVAGR